jgi:hypothetical protein
MLISFDSLILVVLQFSYSEVMWGSMAGVMVVIVFVSESGVSVMEVDVIVAESGVSVMSEVSVVSVAIVEVGKVVFAL